MRSIMIVLMLSIFGMQSSALEISYVKSLGEPKLPIGKADYQLAFAQIAWIGRTQLLYNRSPHYWGLDVTTGSFVRLPDVENRVEGISSGALAMARADSAVLDYGRIFHLKYAAFGYEYGWRDIDEATYEKLAVHPIVNNPTPDPRLHYDWEYGLLGNYALVPRPIYDSDTCGISVREPKGSTLIKLPVEYYEFKNISSYAEVAISFDRFRIAVVGQIVRQKATGPYELGWRVYLLKAIYDGAAAVDATVHADPSSSSGEVGRIEKNTRLRATDAMNYETDKAGRQDFWYFVETDQTRGWVFGGDLLIEGQTWQERLQLRGEPVDLDALFNEKK